MDLNSSDSSGPESEPEEAPPPRAPPQAARRKKGKAACWGRPKRKGQPASERRAKPKLAPAEVTILGEVEEFVDLVGETPAPPAIEDVNAETSDEESSSDDERGTANNFVRNHDRAAKRALRCVPEAERAAWLALPLAEQLKRTQQLGRPKRERKQVELLTVTSLKGRATKPYKTTTPRGVRSSIVVESGDEDASASAKRRKRAAPAKKQEDFVIILDAGELAAAAEGGGGDAPSGNVSPAACPFEATRDDDFGDVQDQEKTQERSKSQKNGTAKSSVPESSKPLKKRSATLPKEVEAFGYHAEVDVQDSSALSCAQPDVQPEIPKKTAPAKSGLSVKRVEDILSAVARLPSPVPAPAPAPAPAPEPPPRLPIANASWRRPRAPAAPAPAGLTELFRSGNPAPLPRSLMIVGQDVPPLPQPAPEEDDYLKRVQREATLRLKAGTAAPNIMHRA